jgi:magnesium transporter
MQSSVQTPAQGRYTGFVRGPDGRIASLPNDDGAIREAIANPDNLVWIDLVITNPDDARILSSVFDFHPLAVEDAVSPHVDPARIDDYGSYLFVVVQALSVYQADVEMEVVEVDFFLGKNYLVSCQQTTVPAIDRHFERPERLELLLQKRSDWALHGLLDALVDDYMPIVDQLDETIDDLENKVLDRAEKELLQQILIAKRNALRLRRATTPQRDIMNRLSRGEFPELVHSETSMYFRDVYDHLVRIEYLIEGLRDLSDAALQTYLSVVSNRLNEIMKVLTAGGAIFFPLTLISGIYGMNFSQNQLPSFDWKYGFPFSLALMAAIAISLLLYFRHRRWI